MKLEIYEADITADRKAISAIFEANRDGVPIEGRYDWLYIRNPFGKARIWLAKDVDTGRIAGACAALPRDFWICGRHVRCHVYSDFSMAMEYRSLGPTVKLNRASLNPALSGEVVFSYDFPSLSMAAAHRWLKVQPFTTLCRYVRPLSPGRILARAFGHVKMPGDIDNFLKPLWAFGLPRPADKRFTFELNPATPEIFDESFSGLDLSMSCRWNVRGVRDRAYLAWRYGENPIRPFVVLSMRLNGDLAGFGICAVTQNGRWRMYDLFTSPARAHMEALLREMIRQAFLHHAEAIEMNLPEGSPWESALKKHHFFCRPGRTEVFVFVNPERPETGVIKNARNWFLTEGDRDT
jgi:hypothetical protein